MEEWRDLVYPRLAQDRNHYSISSFGNLKNAETGRILKPQKLSSGYLSVKVAVGRDEYGLPLGLHILLHKAVAYTFIPNPDDLPEVNHGDGDKTNNRVDNLEWVTSPVNQQHKYDTGLIDKSKISGENNHCHKLTWDAVHYIRSHFVDGSEEFGLKELARKFGVSSSTVYCVVVGRTWREDT